ncbi:hypothetical protein BGZ50_008792, partial [Haplosporangium sp. Z 11]
MTDPSIASPPGIGSSSNSALTPSLTTHGRSVSHGTPFVSGEQDEKGLHGYDKSTSYPRARKRDKFFKIFRSAKPVVQLNTEPLRPETKNHHNQSASTGAKGDDSNGASSVRISNHRPETLSTAEKAKAFSNVFSKNVVRPASEIALPKLHARIDNTHQLALYGGLFKHPVLSPPNETGLEYDPDQTKESTQDAATDDAHRDWVKAMVQNPLELDHIRWLLARMVQEFIDDAVKGRDVITEIILLGPVLDRVHYRKLLSCFILEFEKSPILDEDLLYGLVQLVQCASEGYLESGDLIKILSVLKIRLQQTHQHSISHQYYLTLAVSRVLDVMAKQEVKDLDRVELSEALGALLSSMRENSDPFLTYQASYAFQALQCVPVNETVLQAVMRHSGAVTQSLIYISGVVNLNISAFLDGLGQLHKTLTDTIAITKSAMEGAQSLIANGQDVFEAIKNGIRSGRQRSWYTAIVGADTLVQQGRLADFKAVVFEAVCRQDPEFQWGICQLLGEIAMDPTWESTTRQEAVDFLVVLYTNDPDWGQDSSVKMWMLTILRLVSVGSDQAITVPALLRQDADEAEAAKFAKPYPLRPRLPLPDVSSLLSRVQNIPPVERKLDQLRGQQCREYDQKVYIPPQAKASLQALDKEALPLMDQVRDFLDSKRQVFLVLGDSGAGKSTFNRHLEHELWKEYKQGGPIPLFINLPAINDPFQDMIDKQLRIHKFSEAEIRELKDYRQMILICDGYDETQLKLNLHTANMLNQKGLDAKMIISCRSTSLGQDYRNQFQPQQSDRYSGATANLYTEAVIVPFSSDQIEDYVSRFVRVPEVHQLMGGRPIWSAEDYMTKLRSIPNMMELVRNPFLLTLSLRALPDVAKNAIDLNKIKVTRLTLYDFFIKQWLEVNTLRLTTTHYRSKLSRKEESTLQELLDEGFVPIAIGFLKDLAAAIFREQDGNPVVEYSSRSDKRSWKFKFFGPEPDTTLLREASPLSRAGVQHSFIHRSLLEYFYSRHVYETSEMKRVSEISQDLADYPLSQRNLVREPSIIQFLAEYVQGDSAFKQGLHQILERSKTDANASQAAANAITILVRAGAHFNGFDLKGIQIPGADLSGGQFDSAQLQGADLRNTNLRNIWLSRADLSNAQMAGVQFGEWPYLDYDNQVFSCAYSVDGKIFAVGLTNDTVSLYNTATWKRTCTLSGHTDLIMGMAFSPSSLQIASGSSDNTVRLWDAETGTLKAILSGHTDQVMSVAFSPCGQQIASGGSDNMVRLWDAKTGAPRAILSGHTDQVMSVAFSPCGQQIASGSYDEMVRLWDVQTSDDIAIVSGHTHSVMSVVFSPNGHLIASGSLDDTVRLWDAKTGACRSILSGHGDAIASVAFSPNSLQIASGSSDNTVRLWDAETGTLRAILSGHTDQVMSVAFSPCGRQIASGSIDKRVRFWDAQAGANDAFLGGHTDYFESVVFSASRPLIASGSFDNTVRIWDPQTGDSFSILRGHTDRITSVVFSPSGQQIASGSEDNTVRLWDAQTGDSFSILRGHTDRITSVVFSPSGQQIASGSEDNTVRLWDAQSGDTIVTLIGHTGSVYSVLFSPSGHHIASTSQDKTVRLWDAQTGETGAILRGHSDSVFSVAFSTNGHQIISGGYDQTMQLWDTESGRRLAVITVCEEPIYRVAWIPNLGGSQFLSASSGDSVYLWRVMEGDDFSLRLLWRSTPNRLGVLCTNIQNVQNLGRIYTQLLKQRGSLGNPAVSVVKAP